MHVLRSPARKAIRLTADLNLSLCSSKFNPSVSSPTQEQTTCCALHFISAPISNGLHRLSPSTIPHPSRMYPIIPASNSSRNLLRTNKPFGPGKQVSSLLDPHSPLLLQSNPHVSPKSLLFMLCSLSLLFFSQQPWLRFAYYLSKYWVFEDTDLFFSPDLLHICSENVF